MLPAIGSVRMLADQGRFGVIVGAQPVGEARDGRQLVALKVEAEAQEKSRPAASAPSSASRSVAPSEGKPSPVGTSTGPPVMAARLPADLTAAERAEMTRLQQRDQQVRQEEKAHAAVAGDLAGPIHYVYQRGPDGRQYAVGGSVGIQAEALSGDPLDAERKAGRMAAAASAATNPSAQDYAAARQAYAFGSARVQQPNHRFAGLDVTL